MTRLEIIQQYIKSVFDVNNIDLVPVSGDASFRKYYRIYIDKDSYIVMDSPPDKEPCEQFIKITQYLESSDINVPHIYHENKKDGVLIISDFGNEPFLDCLNNDNAETLYKDAIDQLINIQKTPISSGLPPYDSKLLMVEMELFEVWLLQKMLDIKLSDYELNSLKQIKDTLVQNALKQKMVFVHRDYHSRNLMFVKQNNPGIIDYQDAVKGPVTYDLVSLVKDCYIKWPKQKTESWLQYYFKASGLENELGFNDFLTHCHLMGVQRHLKASGIFARLKLRDGKPNYINDIPRTLSYVTDLSGIKLLEPLIEIIESRVLPSLLEK